MCVCERRHVWVCDRPHPDPGLHLQMIKDDASHDIPEGSDGPADGGEGRLSPALLQDSDTFSLESGLPETN